MLALGRRLRPAWVSVLVVGLAACNSGGPKRTPNGDGKKPIVVERVERVEPEQQGVGTSAGSSEIVQKSGGWGASRIQTVFVILLENKAWSAMKGNEDAPYLNRVMLPRASVAAGYRAPHAGGLHPSEPNYVWLEAGDNLGITDDAEPSRNHRNTPDHLVTLLGKANVTWRTYQEDIEGDACPLTRVRMYKPKHNPMVFFDDVTDANDPGSRGCIEHMRPLSELEADLSKGKVARYNFITPNECHDMHTTCDPLRNVVKQGDDWLAEWVPRILGSTAYQDRGALFITWDEAELRWPDCPFGDCPIGLVLLSPLAKGGGYTNTVSYDHGSLLRTLQEIFGVSPFLRDAAKGTDLSDLFTASP